MTDEEKKARNRPKEHSASNLRTADKTDTDNPDLGTIWDIYTRTMAIEAQTDILKTELKRIAKATTNTSIPKAGLERWGFIQ